MQYTKYDVLFFGLTSTGLSLRLEQLDLLFILNMGWSILSFLQLEGKSLLTTIPLLNETFEPNYNRFQSGKALLYFPHAGNSEISWNFLIYQKVSSENSTPQWSKVAHIHQGFTVPPSSMVRALDSEPFATARRLVKSFNSGTGKTCSSRSSRPSECMLPCMAHLEFGKWWAENLPSYFILRLKMFNEEKMVWGCLGWVRTLNAFWR